MSNRKKEREGKNKEVKDNGRSASDLAASKNSSESVSRWLGRVSGDANAMQRNKSRFELSSRTGRVAVGIVWSCHSSTKDPKQPLLSPAGKSHEEGAGAG